LTYGKGQEEERGVSLRKSLPLQESIQCGSKGPKAEERRNVMAKAQLRRRGRRKKERKHTNQTDQGCDVWPEEWGEEAKRMRVEEEGRKAEKRYRE
jgi:hypothetical protein